MKIQYISNSGCLVYPVSTLCIKELTWSSNLKVTEQKYNKLKSDSKGWPFYAKESFNIKNKLVWENLESENFYNYNNYFATSPLFWGKYWLMDPNYKKIDSKKLEKLIKENAVALDIRLDNQWKKTGVIKGSFQETAFDIDGKFNVYLLDKIRALAGEESQGIELIFISHDGKTAEILGNAFAEDLGFTNVYVLDGGIQSWINSNKPLEKYN